MEKSIKVDGRTITFKSVASTPVRYTTQFGNDYFSDLKKFENDNKQSDGVNETVNVVFLYKVAWVMAKTADDSIPDMYDWLDEFDAFPIEQVIELLPELIQASFGTVKKKNHPALK